jgi:hypothetical protein
VHPHGGLYSVAYVSLAVRDCAGGRAVSNQYRELDKGK